jgi:monovalent cation/hydrogen antiporter
MCRSEHLSDTECLPTLLRGLAVEPDADVPGLTKALRLAAAHAAVGAVETAVSQCEEPERVAYNDASTRVLAPYRCRVEAAAAVDSTLLPIFERNEIEHKLMLTGLRAERTEIFRLGRAGAASDDIIRALVRELDLQEIQHGLRAPLPAIGA